MLRKFNGDAIRRTESYLVVEDMMSARNLRKVPSARPKGGGARQSSGRTPGRKDRDRILYTEAFHRLVGVTQVVSPNLAVPQTHNRLTHSIKVGQIARSIAEQHLRASVSDDQLTRRILRFGGLDADVAEAAALAHDLGHPPFGHIAEVAFDSWALHAAANHGLHVPSLQDGFEGNAQSFRIVTKLEGYGPAGAGLNLTTATKAAILKYPWLRPSKEEVRKHRASPTESHRYEFMSRKFGSYTTERDEFDGSRAWLETLNPNGPTGQTLEASIMDVSDDITYAIHDLEDFYRAGMLDLTTILEELNLFPSGKSRQLNELQKDLAADYPDLYSADEFTSQVKVALTTLQNSLGTSYEPKYEAQLREFVSNAIHAAVTSTFIVEQPTGDVGALMLLGCEQWHTIQLYKHFLKAHVLDREDLGIVQYSQTMLIVELLNRLREWKSADSTRLPARMSLLLQAAGTDSGQYSEARGYMDYLCTLTDTQAVNLHDTLFGFRIPAMIRR